MYTSVTVSGLCNVCNGFVTAALHSHCHLSRHIFQSMTQWAKIRVGVYIIEIAGKEVARVPRDSKMRQGSGCPYLWPHMDLEQSHCESRVRESNAQDVGVCVRMIAEAFAF